MMSGGLGYLGRSNHFGYVLWAGVLCLSCGSDDNPVEAAFSGGSSSTGGPSTGTFEATGGSSIGSTSLRLGVGGSTNIVGGSVANARGGQGNGGTPVATTTTGATTGRVFAEDYAEPTWATIGLPKPMPGVLVTLPDSCEGHNEVCYGNDHDVWLVSLLAACEVDVGTCGGARITFEASQICPHLVLVDASSSVDFAQCVATLAYRTSCSDDVPPSTSTTVQASSCR
jgi:hypothetical protein